MLEMTKMQKIVLLLTFHFSPWGAAKGLMWEEFSHDQPYTEDTVLSFFGFIVNGVDDSRMEWEALAPFIEKQNEEMSNPSEGEKK